MGQKAPSNFRNWLWQFRSDLWMWQLLRTLSWQIRYSSLQRSLSWDLVCWLSCQGLEVAQLRHRVLVGEFRRCMRVWGRKFIRPIDDLNIRIGARMVFLHRLGWKDEACKKSVWCIQYSFPYRLDHRASNSQWTLCWNADEKTHHKLKVWWDVLHAEYCIRLRNFWHKICWLLHFDRGPLLRKPRHSQL